MTDYAIMCVRAYYISVSMYVGSYAFSSNIFHYISLQSGLLVCSIVV